MTDSREDLIDAALEALEAGVLEALERCGQSAVDAARERVPAGADALRDSLAYRVEAQEHRVSIGTDHPCGTHIELGMGQSPPQSGGGACDIPHGQQAQPFLKPALTENLEAYRQIIQDALQGD